MDKTTLKGKLALIVLGSFLTLIILEAGLRSGGFLFLSIQEHRNKASFQKHNDYRILCLGESTTALGGADSYPRQLERILNSYTMGKTFTVINKGIPAMTTTDILANLRQNINEYKPHIIITMMGINDLQDPFGKTKKAAAAGRSVFERLRTYKLAKLLLKHLANPSPGKGESSTRFEKALKNLEIKLKTSPSSRGFMKLGILYWGIREGARAKEAFLRAHELDPNDYEILGNLALQHKRLGEYAEAIPLFQKVLEHKALAKDYKMKMENYLADSYRILGDFGQAAGIYQNQISMNPNHPTAYDQLARILARENQYAAAEKLFEAQIRTNPYSAHSYSGLAHLYRKSGRLDAAEVLLKKALIVNPDEAVLYAELGSEFFRKKKYREAEEIFSKGLALRPENSMRVDFHSFYTYLQACYEAQGKHDKIKELEMYVQKEYGAQTQKNYRAIKKILEQENIQLIAVQYPLRDIEPLKEILQPAEKIIFVENKKIFEEAVGQSSYDDYFTDRFAVDFGHCTAKGNRLLAQNIAEVMMTELFAQSGTPPPSYARQ